MSGWDQKGDIHDWSFDVNEEMAKTSARKQIKQNKIYRWVWWPLGSILTLLGILLFRWSAVVSGATMFALAIANEHSIHKLKESIK
jgi:hypothetical protein